MNTGGMNKTFLYFTCDSGRLPSGQISRQGDTHNQVPGSRSVKIHGPWKTGDFWEKIGGFCGFIVVDNDYQWWYEWWLISGFHSGFPNESNCPRSYLQYPRCSSFFWRNQGSIWGSQGGEHWGATNWASQRGSVTSLRDGWWTFMALWHWNNTYCVSLSQWLSTRSPCCTMTCCRGSLTQCCVRRGRRCTSFAPGKRGQPLGKGGMVDFFRLDMGDLNWFEWINKCDWVLAGFFWGENHDGWVFWRFGPERMRFGRRLSIERNNAELWLGTWEIRKAHWKVLYIYVCIWYIYIFYFLLLSFFSVFISYIMRIIIIHIYIYHWIWNSNVIISTENIWVFPSGHVTASSVPRCWRAHNSTNGFGASHGHHFFGPISNTTFRYPWSCWSGRFCPDSSFKLQTQLALLRPHADVDQNRVPYPNGFNRRFSRTQAI